MHDECWMNCLSTLALINHFTIFRLLNIYRPWDSNSRASPKMWKLGATRRNGHWLHFIVITCIRFRASKLRLCKCNPSNTHLNSGLFVFFIIDLLNILERISKLLFKHSFNSHFHGGGWARAAPTSPCLSFQFFKKMEFQLPNCKTKHWFQLIAIVSQSNYMLTMSKSFKFTKPKIPDRKKKPYFKWKKETEKRD